MDFFRVKPKCFKRTSLKSSTPLHPTQYWFGEYFSVVTSQQFSYFQRSTRSQPNLQGVQIQQRAARDCEAMKNDHQALILSILEQANKYWWGHSLWWDETKKILPAAGKLLNYLGNELSVNFKNPLKVREGRCSVCNAVIQPDSSVKGGPKYWTSHKTRQVNDTRPRSTATFRAIA